MLQIPEFFACTVFRCCVVFLRLAGGSDEPLSCRWAYISQIFVNCSFGSARIAFRLRCIAVSDSTEAWSLRIWSFFSAKVALSLSSCFPVLWMTCLCSKSCPRITLRNWNEVWGVLIVIVCVAMNEGGVWGRFLVLLSWNMRLDVRTTSRLNGTRPAALKPARINSFVSPFVLALS
jgi:hypothetical protein